MRKLKPCPVCGSEAKLTVYNTYIASFTRADKYYVCCSKNYHHSRQEDPLGFLSREQAIEAWNRREPEQEKSGEQMEIDLTSMLLGGKP